MKNLEKLCELHRAIFCKREKGTFIRYAMTNRKTHNTVNESLYNVHITTYSHTYNANDEIGPKMKSVTSICRQQTTITTITHSTIH